MHDIDANPLPIKTSAPVSKAIRPMFSAPVSARIVEFGHGMPGWEDGSRGYLDERGYFEITSENGEIIIEYCSSNSKEHAGFIHRPDIQYKAGFFHSRRNDAGLRIKRGGGAD